MFEKVNPSHPDKLADRIAGAMVDYAYSQEENPKIAVEVLLGHGKCLVIAETSVDVPEAKVREIVKRISGVQDVEYIQARQDPHLAQNQSGKIRCGDNGIFKGVPTSVEERALTSLAQFLWKKWPYDGKYIQTRKRLIICHSNVQEGEIRRFCNFGEINPLGYWTGGSDVDSGATNRKLGSDMGRAVTGGGLHGKDLSKADVSVNIYAHLKAQEKGRPVELSCAIGDETVDGKPYSEIVDIAREYVADLGGFESLAEWGLIR